MHHWFGLVWKMQCQGRGTALRAVSHRGTSLRLRNGLRNSQNKIRKTWSLGCFFLSFLAPLPMKCLRQGETGSIPWNHWHEKAGISPLPLALQDSSSPEQNCCSSRGILRGWGHVQGQLGPARPHNCPLGTASLARSEGHELLLARKCFRRSKGNGRETSHMNSQLAAAARSICSAHHSLEHEAVLQKWIWRKKPQKTKFKIQSHQQNPTSILSVCFA